MSRYDLHKETRPHPSNPLLLVEFIAQEEFTDPTNHFENIQDVRWIIEEQHKGNMASWFSARVNIRVIGTDARSVGKYLGCCSYKSFDDFYACEYYSELVQEATDDLMNTLAGKIQEAESAVKVLKELRKGQ